MKVILNKDLATLGEEGDIKEVARGYARNYLFPRGIAMPLTSKTLKIIEARKSEIEARKEQKRLDARSLKEKLDSTELSITMPAGANGKLYGAVTNQTIADELAKIGFQIERKRIEIPGSGIKNAGKYKAVIKLYENQSAEISMTIIGQEIKTESHDKAKPQRKGRKDKLSQSENSFENSADNSSEKDAQEAQPEKEPAKGGTGERKDSKAGQIPYFYFMGK